MHLMKTPNLGGRIRLSIVDTYYDDVLEKLELVYSIPYSNRILSLGEIKNILANTKKKLCTR
jgi:hypothetical protein